ncbi:uncharacterized protein [Cardiocondyla obscurior]|uniref:uncharacterized protein n=1 Tax=Cardiocondyla obscurior TaxID=286306 RepID=UPI0039656868
MSQQSNHTVCSKYKSVSAASKNKRLEEPPYSRRRHLLMNEPWTFRRPCVVSRAFSLALYGGKEDQPDIRRSERRSRPRKGILPRRRKSWIPEKPVHPRRRSN